MNKSESRRMARLEAENAKLHELTEKQWKDYCDQLHEIVDLKMKIKEINEIINGSCDPCK